MNWSKIWWAFSCPSEFLYTLWQEIIMGFPEVWDRNLVQEATWSWTSPKRKLRKSKFFSWFYLFITLFSWLGLWWKWAASDGALKAGCKDCLRPSFKRSSFQFVLKVNAASSTQLNANPVACFFVPFAWNDFCIISPKIVYSCFFLTLWGPATHLK